MRTRWLVLLCAFLFLAFAAPGSEMRLSRTSRQEHRSEENLPN